MTKTEDPEDRPRPAARRGAKARPLPSRGAGDALDFASGDGLGLASHRAILAAARAALREWGPHAAERPALLAPGRELERQLAFFLGLPHGILFPCGWSAGFAAVRALLLPGDHLLLDADAAAPFLDAARAAGAEVHLIPHLAADAAARHLAELRRLEPANRIVVATQGLFPADASVPDLVALRGACRRFDATLLLDVAQDLGVLAPHGRGSLEAQRLLGSVDVVTGSLGEALATPGGFVAVASAGLAQALRSTAGPMAGPAALSPIQSAIALRALAIIGSAEGEERRGRLMAAAMRLRAGLSAAGFRLAGLPGPVVPVILGDSAFAQLATRFATEAGARLPLVEQPAAAQWRLRIRADHGAEQVDRFVALASGARDRALREMQRLGRPARAA